jgi:hypothetical protein
MEVSNGHNDQRNTTNFLLRRRKNKYEAVYMVDTVCVGFPISPTLAQLENWSFFLSRYPNGSGKISYRIRRLTEKGAVIKGTYYPSNDRYSFPMTLFELSLPIVLRGNNIDLIYDEAELIEAISEVNKSIRNIRVFPEVDVGLGILTRLDIAYNHQVGESVYDYIRALSNLEYSRRKTMPYLYEGVQYMSKSVTTKFYNKEGECRDFAAYGILRQETTMRHSHVISRQFSRNPARLMDIEFDKCKELLSNNLHMLGLENNPIYGKSSVHDILLETYGCKKGIELYGWWMERQTQSTDQLLKAGMKKKTIQRNDNLIKDAGIPLTMSDTALPLPPLVIMDNNVLKYK